MEQFNDEKRNSNIKGINSETGIIVTP